MDNRVGSALGDGEGRSPSHVMSLGKNLRQRKQQVPRPRCGERSWLALALD